MPGAQSYVPVSRESGSPLRLEGGMLPAEAEENFEPERQAAPRCTGRGWRRAAALILLPAVVLTILGSRIGSSSTGTPTRAGQEQASGHMLEALRARAGQKSDRQANLQTTMLWKWGNECIGYDKCPEYPMPFEYGKLPQTYNYEGEFPKDFVWGLGTAAYQIEGAYNEDGRGASIWDTFTGANTVGMPGANCSYCCKKAPCPVNEAMGVKGATGNVANDHYHMYPVDVALMKSMGLKHYRFSISWPRIVPTGNIADGINQKGLDFYNNLIDALIEAGITPYITLYHWDLPQGLMDPPRVNGWYSRDANGKPDGAITQHFVDYADICFNEFGDRVKTWMTFNEAWTFTYLASGWGKAPSIKEFDDHSVDPWIAGHNVLLAHAAAVDLFRKKYQKAQGGLIGMVNNCDWREPKTDKPEDVAAAARAVEFWLGWMSDPLYTGDYPPAMRKIYGDRLPHFTKEQQQLLNGSVDFFGLNSYGVGFVEFTPDEPQNDHTYGKVTEDGIPKAQSSWLFGHGWGLRKLVNWVSRRYGNPPIYITEGGWSLEANTSDVGCADSPRTYYYANYTEEVLRAIQEDGVDVRGYFAWSLMDNFEWERGYLERFGTTYNDFKYGLDENAPVDKENQPTAGSQYRRRKDSSCWLEAVWRSGSLVDPAKFEGCVDSSVLPGDYSDPSADDGCKRSVKLLKDGTAEVSGTSGRGAKGCTGAAREWTAPAIVDGGSIVQSCAKHAVKCDPLGLHGFWDISKKGIQWSDGSFWKKEEGDKDAKNEESEDEAGSADESSEEDS